MKAVILKPLKIQAKFCRQADKHTGPYIEFLRDKKVHDNGLPGYRNAQRYGRDS